MSTRRRRRILLGGGFIPTNQSGNVLWLDAADTSPSNIGHISGSVSAWSDKSGNANNASQLTGSAQPVTGTRNINGKNAIDFNGSSHFMAIADSPSISLTGDCTFFIVGHIDTVTTNRTYLEKSGNDAYRLRVNGTTPLAWMLISDGTFQALESTSPVTTGDAAIITTAVNIGTDVTFRNNGVAIGSPATTKSSIQDTAGSLNVGSNLGFSEFWDGLIGEIIIYDRLLTSGEIARTESYLEDKWGV